MFFSCFFHFSAIYYKVIVYIERVCTVEGVIQMIKKINLLAVLLLACSPLVYGDITGSPHDLSGKTTGAVGSDDNGELCVYCHTPHAANTAFDGAPLWNKTATAGLDYMMYGATAVNTAGATIANTATATTPASPSLACLSCHDGISAIDSIVNAPGSGMGALAAGTAGQNIVDALTTAYGGNIGGTPGTATAGTTVDLSNDHPVSIPYMGTGATDSPASLRATTFDLTTYGDGVAWVGATTIADLLRNGNVECGSCHDPHNGGKVQGTDTEVNFLRHSNTNSNLCIGCHAK